MRGGKKKGSHPVSNRRPNDREACALPVALKVSTPGLKNLFMTFMVVCVSRCT